MASRSHLMALLCPTLAKPCREENSASIDQLSTVETVQCHHKVTEREKSSLEKSDNAFILLYILQDYGAYRDVNRNGKVTFQRM